MIAPYQHIARADGESARHQRARTFLQIVRVFALGGSIGGARREADKLGLSDAAAVIKAVTSASTIDQLGEFQALAAAWLRNLQNTASGAILDSAVMVPKQTRVGLVSQIVAGSVDEGQGKTVRGFSLNPADVPALKAACIVVGTRELFESRDFPVSTLENELKNGVALATDTAMLTVLLNGAPSIAATGDADADLALLLAAVPRGAASRPVLVGGVSVRDQASLLPQNQRRPGRLPVAGNGQVLDLPFYTSDSLAAGTLALVDCSQIAAWDQGIAVDSARHTSLQMDDDPTQGSTSPPTPTNLVSMFQTNSIALRCERRFGVKRMRTDAVAQLTGLGAGSPVVTW